MSEPKASQQYRTTSSPAPESGELTPQLIEMIETGIREINARNKHGHIVLVIVDGRVKMVKLEFSLLV